VNRADTIVIDASAAIAMLSYMAASAYLAKLRAEAGRPG
jgi:hypothetical protein